MAVRVPRWFFSLFLALSCGSLWPHALHAQTAPAAAPQSSEEEQKARAHFRLGRAHYDNGDFAQAAVEFEEAYRISQRPALLYNIYLAYRDANDTRHAAEALRNYLTLEKDVENRGQLESRLAALERSLADGTAPQPAAQAQPTQAQAAQPDQATAAAQPETTAAPTAATEAEPTHKKSLLLPIILMGTGGAMIVVSLVTGAMAAGKQSDLEKACPNKSVACDPKNKALADSGKSLATVSTILTIGGIAVAGTGAVLFLLSLGKGSESSQAPAVTASAACLPGACGGSVRFAF